MSILQTIFTPQYVQDPPAFFHPRILVGPGCFLTPSFVQKYGITHVINCAFSADSPPWWRDENPSKYKCINAIDSTTVNILRWYPDFERTMQEYLRQGSGVVYVHCQAGINRSGSLALAYATKNLGMGFDTLVSSVRRQRPCILQNTVFMNQVKDLINGRVQSSETERINKSEYHDRYARFFAPGDRADSKGHEDNAGDITRGARPLAFGNITPIFEERD